MPGPRTIPTVVVLRCISDSAPEAHSPRRCALILSVIFALFSGLRKILPVLFWLDSELKSTTGCSQKICLLDMFRATLPVACFTNNAHLNNVTDNCFHKYILVSRACRNYVALTSSIVCRSPPSYVVTTMVFTLSVIISLYNNSHNSPVDTSNF